MQLLTHIPGRVRGRTGRLIRRDRIVPVTQPREDVRGHVQSVRRGRRDLRVCPCSAQPPWGQLGAVIGMDQVVRKTGVLRQPAVQRLEDLRRALLVGVRTVGRRRRRNECQGVEDLRFDILGIAPRDIRHCMLIRQGSGGVRQAIRVAIVRGRRIDELALAQ